MYKFTTNETEIASIESLIQEMKKVLIKDTYQAELDTHIGYGKNEERPEELDEASAISPRKCILKYLRSLTFFYNALSFTT